MKTKERVISVTVAAVMVVAVCMAAVYASPAIPEVLTPPAAAEAVTAEVSISEADDSGVLLEKQPALTGDIAQLSSLLGSLSKDQTEKMLSIITDGKMFESSGNDISDLLKALGGYFPQGLPDGFDGLIPEQFNSVLAAFTGSGAAFDSGFIKTVLDKINELLDRALSDGIITQEQYDKINSFKENGSFELSNEQREMIQAKLEVAKESILVEADNRLTVCLEEGVITVGLYDILKSAMDTGKLENTDELAAELKAIAGRLLVIGLDESDLITQGLYDILISAIETGDFEFSMDLVLELQTILLKLAELGLNEGNLDQEQYDWLVKEIKIAVIQIEMREWLPK